MNNKRLALVKIFVGVFVLSFLSVNINADISPNWNLNNINSQVRSLTTNYSGIQAVIGGASMNGSANSNTMYINGLNVSTADDPAAAYNNGTDVLVGGAIYHNTADNNRVQILNSSTIQGRTVMGGAAFLQSLDDRTGSANVNNNSVYIKDSSVLSSTHTTGSVYGGFSNYNHGSINNNSVTIDNSVIAGDVYGSYDYFTTIPSIDYEPNGDVKDEFRPDVVLDKNTVRILNGSVVTHKVVGAVGQDKTSGSLVEIDASTVGDVFGSVSGFVLYNGTTSVSYTDNNTVIIRNGSNVDSAIAGGGSSTNARGNKLIVDNSTVNSGSLYSASITLDLRGENHDIPINAEAVSNSLTLNNLPVSTSSEIAASLNWAGVANENTTTLTNIPNLTVNRALTSFGLLQLANVLIPDYKNLDTDYNLFSLRNQLDIPVSQNTFDSTYGFIYGGAALDYTSQVNTPVYPSGGVVDEDAQQEPSVAILANGGYEANNNTVSISNATIHSNIIGGFSGQIKEIDYTLFSAGSDASSTIKTVVQKIGNEIQTITYDCDGNGQNCVIKEYEAELTESAGLTFSANNNTVVLENVDLDGVVYGGFVIGADLNVDEASTSNNTVIIRGNTTLSNTSIVYGGNALLGRTTNKLVFDHVAGSGGSFVTYSNVNQFQNFNPIWQVNADLDTRVDFQMPDINAIVNIDSQQEGTATIIKTQTASDLTDVEQNGVITDLIDTNMSLGQDKKGVYSFDLVPTKLDPTTVGWVLSVFKDSHNAEVYGQVPLVGLALAAEGPDMLSKAFSDAWNSQLDSSTFLDAGYHHTRYHTGSGFDLDSGIMQAGFWKKLNEETLGGFFVKYAFGNYETFPIKATGNANAYGGGLMASYRYSETGRLEANVEVGYLDLEFKSNQLSSTLDTKGVYYGALFGLVEELTSNWNAYANLQFLRKGKDSMTDNLGQKVEYQAMQSVAFRAGTDVSFPTLAFAEIVPSLGVSCLYEFDGKSKLYVSDMGNDEASMRGLSGRGEVAFTYDSDNGPFPLISKLTIFGLAGKRSGFGGEVNFAFRF